MSTLNKSSFAGHVRVNQLVFRLIGLILTALLIAAPIASAAPIGQWHPNSIAAVVEPGTVDATVVTFVASRSAANVAFRVVPAIAPYVRVSPSSFSEITKGQQYKVLVTISADFLAAPGIYDGVIQLREGGNTAPQPLPVSIRISAAHRYSISAEGEIHPVDEVVLQIVEGASRADADALAGIVNGYVIDAIFEPDVYLLHVPANSEAELQAAISLIASDPRVLAAVTNPVLLPNDATNDNDYLRDTYPDLTAAFDRVAVDKAWRTLGSSRSVRSARIGVVDTGIDTTHDEFNLVSVSGEALTDAGFPATRCNASGVLTHGTAVAGIIGADNRAAGDTYALPHMSGIVAGPPKSAYRLISERFGTQGASMKAVQRAIDQGANIINMSFGSTSCSVYLLSNPCGCTSSLNFPVFRLLWQRKFDANPNVLFVASAGNGVDGIGVDAKYHLPGGAISRPNLITVAATKLAERSAWGSDSAEWTDFSNFGASIDIAAPGEGIYAPGRRFLDAGEELSLFHYWNKEGQEDPDGDGIGRFFGGTSGATPIVTGVAALMLAYSEGGLSPEQIKQILRDTATPRCQGQSAREGCLINADAAIKRAMASSMVSYEFTGVVTSLFTSDAAYWAGIGINVSVGTTFSGRLTYDRSFRYTSYNPTYDFYVYDGALKSFEVTLSGNLPFQISAPGIINHEPNPSIGAETMQMFGGFSRSGRSLTTGFILVSTGSWVGAYPPLPSALPPLSFFDMWTDRIFRLSVTDDPGRQIRGRLTSLVKQ